MQCKNGEKRRKENKKSTSRLVIKGDNEQERRVGRKANIKNR